MQAIQQANNTEGKGVREKALMLRPKSLTCICYKQLPRATKLITQEQDMSQASMVSFQTSLLLSQTCYKGHKHQVIKHSSSVWKKFSSLRFWDVVTWEYFFELCAPMHLQIQTWWDGYAGKWHLFWTKPTCALLYFLPLQRNARLRKNTLSLSYVATWWHLSWDVEVTSAMDNSERNSCSFPIAAQDLCLELAFCSAANGQARVLLA